MSLTVSSYTLDADGKMAGMFPPTIQFWREPGYKDLTREQQHQRWREANPNPGEDMAGPELYRKEVWGSETVCSLGCTLLPTLKERDIYATGGQIEQLEREVGMLRDNIALVSERTAQDVERLEHYLQNMTEAIGRARAISGGVVIW